MIGTETRENLMSARAHINFALDARGDVSLATAAALIDRALKDLCPHLRETWHIATDNRGRRRMTCYACGMWWYEHKGTDQDASATGRRREQQDGYLDYLDIKLRIREREHGHAYMTPFEIQRLLAYDLRQPGHTVHRFSTPSEDRSDANLAAIALRTGPERTSDTPGGDTDRVAP